MVWQMFMILAAFVLQDVKSVPLKLSKQIDMSYPFNNDTIYWPGSTVFKHTIVFRGQTPAYYYESNDYSGAEHGGTHMDAPAHFYKGKWRLADIPVERFFCQAIVIDVSAKASANVDYQMSVEDLINWEKTHGQIPDHSILMVYNDWGRRWPDKASFLGTDTTNTDLLHFPGVHKDAATWLVENRNIYGIGIDTASIDYGQSKNFSSHQIFGEQNIFLLENVANMDKLPAKGMMVHALPMKITDGSGGPTRIVALQYEGLVSRCNILSSYMFVVIVAVISVVFEVNA